MNVEQVLADCGGPVVVPGRTEPSATESTHDKQQYHRLSEVVRTDVVDATTLALIAAGLPENTRRAYRQDRQDYAAWCQRRGLAPLPLVPEQLAAWAAYQLTVGSSTVAEPRPRAVSSVSRSLSAVSTMSVEHGLGKADLRLARLVLRGWQREHAQAAVRRAAPATPDVLRAMLAHTETDPARQPTTRGLRDRALLLVAFSIAARRSEVVGLDISSFTFVPEGMVIRVLRSKTKSRVDEVGVPFGYDPQLCPVRALRAHLDRMASVGLCRGPAFRRVTRTGVVLEHRLQPAYVATLVATLADRAGLEVPPGFASWAGHSLRRGCAVSLRAAGADAQALTAQGGWAPGSTAVGTYLVEADRFARHPLTDVL
jgi:site-specific recombinase XerD